ncbi:hypothetical protein BX600DRAFT_509761 [Xylariales sp. PMI_506]|nr:hypothetical protein BX600DRAFT_509761 [Xylariales sp. PMI_506]
MSLISMTPFQLTGRYADRYKWENLNGPGDSRVTALQVVEDEDILDAWHDKVILITGVSSGMGPEIVRAMAATGATIYATARNLDKAKAALGTLMDTGRVHLLGMEQTDLASVRTCVEEFKKKSQVLNIMINNAAVMRTPEGRTKDGFELQFGTNHLSHFLLFYLLQDLLLQSSSPGFQSRVVNVSSSGHRYGPLRLNNPNLEGIYEGWSAYGASKTANIYMSTELDRLYGARGLRGYSVSPGSFVSPNLQKFCVEEMAEAERDPRVSKYLSNPEQGAATVVYGAVARDLEGKGGLYLEGASIAGPCPPDGDNIEYGYGSWAFDEVKERQLWELSKKMVRVE